MDWSTVWMLAGFVAFYAVGKGIGRAQGKDSVPPHIVLMLELEGDAIGGIHIGGVRPIHIDHDRPTGPPPGHPDHDPHQ